ncbi:hypothetical protein BBK14_13595 [Parafrankia soli]|uniref:Uncharacterized protein n=1 Tax=Parafrankia soli TaxID=2599596 RepID=A0A1S1R0I2_9ACTN|nr:hypothetical protein [Parafrankia soli]OHV39700.1 hypothetical protein BBK14_13595 [Parafrankia soli]
MSGDDDAARDFARIDLELRVLQGLAATGGLSHVQVRRRTQELAAEAGYVPAPPPEQERVDVVLGWLHRQQLTGGDTVSVSEIHRGVYPLHRNDDGRRWCRRVTDVQDVVSALVDAGYLRTLPAPLTTRGRQPSPRYELLRAPYPHDQHPTDSQTGGAR